MSLKKQFVLLLGLGLAACSAPKNTAELKIRVSESHLAPVPFEQRMEVAEAQEAVFRAKWRLEYTKTELEMAKGDVDIAKNELEKAKLSAENADTRMAHAENTADQDLIRDATRREQVAALEIDVAERELAKARQQLEYLEARLEAARLAHRREEARVEYAKARSMAAAGVRPPDFNPKSYEKQFKSREQMASAAIQRAQQRKAELAKTEKGLTAARAQLRQAQGATSGGGASPIDEPMDPTGPEPFETPDEPVIVDEPDEEAGDEATDEATDATEDAPDEATDDATDEATDDATEQPSDDPAEPSAAPATTEPAEEEEKNSPDDEDDEDDDESQDEDDEDDGIPDVEATP